MPENQKRDEKVILHDDLEGDLMEHEQERVENEMDEQQDLNQGMSTGTHSTTRTGANWPRSYRGKLAPKKKKRAE
jgi:hypothetical protein